MARLPPPVKVRANSAVWSGCAAVLLVAALAGTGVGAAAEPPALVLVGTADTARAQGRWLELIYGEALRRIGYRLDYRLFPVKRASALSDSGEVDGEIHRVADYALTHPNMLRLSPSHFTLSFSAYATRPLALEGGWDSFRSAGLRVECRAGVARCDHALRPIVPPHLLSMANSITLGLRKLEHQRSDVYIDIEPLVDAVLLRPEFQPTAIRKVARLEVVDAHAFLHKKHRDLVPRLSQVLADMKREGLIEKYRVEADKLPPMVVD